MGEIFTALARAVQGAPAIALLAAVAWGVLSVVLSPCHLASIPLIVAFVSGQGATTVRRAFALSLVFAVGILATIAAIGVATAAAGRMIGDVGRVGSYVVAAVLFVVGLHLVGVIPMPWSASGSAGVKRKGFLGALLLGLIFGTALGPCTFGFMAPMLAVALRAAAANVVYGALLLLAFGVGHCAVIVCAGTFTGVVQRYLSWTERSRGASVLRKVCGVLVMLGSVYLIYSAR
jgi:cytochrome c-type biogenesis protein